MPSEVRSANYDRTAKRARFGRKEKRKINRSMRRKEGEVEEKVEEVSEEEKEVEEEDDEEKGSEAYGTLVGLLKEGEVEEDDEVEVHAGNQVVEEVEEEEEEEEEEETEVEAEDTGNEFDAFDRHFNDEERISRLVSEDPPLKLWKRSKIEDYVKLDYRYEEGEELKGGFGAKMAHLNVKNKIRTQFDQANLSPLAQQVAESLLTYQNINLQYYHSDVRSEYQKCYLLHVLNHVLKTRAKIVANNQAKKKALETGDVDDDQYRDQGYTRAKVLILLPTRNSAWEVVSQLTALSGISAVDNKKRFKDQFYDSFGSGHTLGEESFREKSDEFQEMFRGNSNDFFCLGVKFTRKTVRLFSGLEQSDVIVASPLGLKMLYEKKSSNAEFLSSIEVTVLDKCEGLLMQNWEHVNEVLGKRLNAPPKKLDEKVDFSRVRMWAINDQFRYVGQVCVFGKYGSPELNRVTKTTTNLQSGVVYYKPVVNAMKRPLVGMGSLHQVFHRFQVTTLLSEPDKRFEFFKNVTLPHVLHKASYDFGTLVYVASYVDYIRLTNYLRDASVSFVAIDEYSSRSKLTRNRALFADAREDAKIMLYTERLHFYKRYSIRGVRNVVFYELPSDPDTYAEVLQFLVDEKARNETDLGMSVVRTQYGKLDMMKLEKVVGMANVVGLVRGEGEVNEVS